jgi:hypothetical protein
MKIRVNKVTVLIDEEDYEKIKNIYWYEKKDKHTSYAIGSKKIKGVRTRYKMHRLILGLTNSEILVDHINHNGLDNRKENLRKCNRKENARNRNIDCRNKLGYKGIILITDRNLKNKYRCRITVDNNSKHIGYFKTIKEAALAYNKASLKYHGDFANLNVLK